jgi:hypothetical protein
VPYEIGSAREGAGAVIRIRVEDGERMWDTYVIDPHRDYMIVRHEWDTIYRQDLGNDKGRMVHEVTDASNATGLWVPMKTHRTLQQFLSKPDKEEHTYVVEAFQRGNVKETDLDVEFPVGTQVVDTMAKASYFVEPGGKKKQGMYYDPATGQVFGPGARASSGPSSAPTTRPAQ